MIPLTTFLADTNNGHSDLQMDRFITVRSGGTPYGCYHQACRELSSRTAGLMECLSQRESTEIKIQIASRKAERATDPLHKRLIQVRVDQLRFGLLQIEHRLQEVRTEFSRFYAQCAALYHALGFDRQPPTADKLTQLDAERWDHNIRCQIAVELFTQGRPGRNTAEALQSLPPEMRRRIGDECLSGEAAQQRCIAWYFDYVPDIPEPITFSDSERLEILECCESSLLRKPSGILSPTAARPSLRQNIENDSKSAMPAQIGADSPVQNAGACCL